MLAPRKLQNPNHERQSVTEIVAGCGIYELGRFAGEYRRLFGELPSETLARSSRAHRCDAAFSAVQMDLDDPGFERNGAQVDRSNTMTLPQSASTMLPSAQPTP